MKKLLLILPVAACIFIIYACNNPTASKPQPAAPLPNNYVDVAAVAAKKADFYARLAFDLADGYLSNNSVVRKRYGKDDPNYVGSLDFGLSGTAGTVESFAISKPIFKYWHYNEYSVPTITKINLASFPDRKTKRRQFVGAGTGATLPSYQYDMIFRNTDVAGEQLPFIVSFTQPGVLTAKGGTINTATPFPISVRDSSGVVHSFDVLINNLTGSIKGVEGTISSYDPSALSEFVISGGKITLTGTDTSPTPHVVYTIVLEYSNDKVENKTGNFISSDGSFTANYTINKDEGYYVKSSDLSRKRYAYWDYPL